MIPYGRQEITRSDIDAVVSVLESDFLTQGPAVPRFEAALAAYTGAAHAVALNSATSALHVACLALEVGPGDVVWTSPITFVASANCARYCGAEVDFVDVDPVTGNMCIEDLERRLEAAEREGGLPKVLIPVHLTGRPVDMRRVGALADRFGFRVIEDASHAVGGRHADEPIGSCRYSDVCIFSFHPVKIITTAEGGLALTNRSELAERMSLLRTHGITRDPDRMTEPPHGPWYYQQIFLGFNYRMTDIQAALGVSQLDRLDTYVARRNELARRYDELLEDLPLDTHPPVADGDLSAWHLFVVHVRRDRRAVFEGLRSRGIGVNVHYIPVHGQPYYRRRPGASHLPGAACYYEGCISLPLFPTLTEEEQLRVVTALDEILA